MSAEQISTKAMLGDVTRRKITWSWRSNDDLTPYAEVVPITGDEGRKKKKEPDEDRCRVNAASYLASNRKGKASKKKQRCAEGVDVRQSPETLDCTASSSPLVDQLGLNNRKSSGEIRLKKRYILVQNSPSSSYKNLNEVGLIPGQDPDKKNEPLETVPKGDTRPQEDGKTKALTSSQKPKSKTESLSLDSGKTAEDTHDKNQRPNKNSSGGILRQGSLEKRSPVVNAEKKSAGHAVDTSQTPGVGCKRVGSTNRVRFVDSLEERILALDMIAESPRQKREVTWEAKASATASYKHSNKDSKEEGKKEVKESLKHVGSGRSVAAADLLVESGLASGAQSLPIAGNVGKNSLKAPDDGTAKQNPPVPQWTQAGSLHANSLSLRDCHVERRDRLFKAVRNKPSLWRLLRNTMQGNSQTASCATMEAAPGQGSSSAEASHGSKPATTAQTSLHTDQSAKKMVAKAHQSSSPWSKRERLVYLESESSILELKGASGTEPRHKYLKEKHKSNAGKDREAFARQRHGDSTMPSSSQPARTEGRSPEMAKRSTEKHVSHHETEQDWRKELKEAAIEKKDLQSTFSPMRFTDKLSSAYCRNLREESGIAPRVTSASTRPGCGQPQSGSIRHLMASDELRKRDVPSAMLTRATVVRSLLRMHADLSARLRKLESLKDEICGTAEKPSCTTSHLPSQNASGEWGNPQELSPEKELAGGRLFQKVQNGAAVNGRRCGRGESKITDVSRRKGRAESRNCSPAGISSDPSLSTSTSERSGSEDRWDIPSDLSPKSHSRIRSRSCTIDRHESSREAMAFWKGVQEALKVKRSFSSPPLLPSINIPRSLNKKRAWPCVGAKKDGLFGAGVTFPDVHSCKGNFVNSRPCQDKTQQQKMPACYSSTSPRPKRKQEFQDANNFTYDLHAKSPHECSSLEQELSCGENPGHSDVRVDSSRTSLTSRKRNRVPRHLNSESEPASSPAPAEEKKQTRCREEDHSNQWKDLRQGVRTPTRNCSLNVGANRVSSQPGSLKRTVLCERAARSATDANELVNSQPSRQGNRGNSPSRKGQKGRGAKFLPRGEEGSWTPYDSKPSYNPFDQVATLKEMLGLVNEEKAASEFGVLEKTITEVKAYLERELLEASKNAETAGLHRKGEEDYRRSRQASSLTRSPGKGSMGMRGFATSMRAAHDSGEWKFYNRRYQRSPSRNVTETFNCDSARYCRTASSRTDVSSKALMLPRIRKSAERKSDHEDKDDTPESNRRRIIQAVHQLIQQQKALMDSARKQRRDIYDAQQRQVSADRGSSLSMPSLVPRGVMPWEPRPAQGGSTIRTSHPVRGKPPVPTSRRHQGMRLYHAWTKPEVNKPEGNYRTRMTKFPKESSTTSKKDRVSGGNSKSGKTKAKECADASVSKKRKLKPKSAYADSKSKKAERKAKISRKAVKEKTVKADFIQQLSDAKVTDTASIPTKSRSLPSVFSSLRASASFLHAILHSGDSRGASKLRVHEDFFDQEDKKDEHKRRAASRPGKSRSRKKSSPADIQFLTTRSEAKVEGRAVAISASHTNAGKKTRSTPAVGRQLLSDFLEETLGLKLLKHSGNSKKKKPMSTKVDASSGPSRVECTDQDSSDKSGRNIGKEPVQKSSLTTAGRLRRSESEKCPKAKRKTSPAVVKIPVYELKGEQRRTKDKNMLCPTSDDSNDSFSNFGAFGPQVAMELRKELGRSREDTIDEWFKKATRKYRKPQRSAVQIRRNFHDPETWVQRMDLRDISAGQNLVIVGQPCPRRKPPSDSVGKKKSKKKRVSGYKIRHKKVPGSKLCLSTAPPLATPKQSIDGHVKKKRRRGKRTKRKVSCLSPSFTDAVSGPLSVTASSLIEESRDKVICNIHAGESTCASIELGESSYAKNSDDLDCAGGQSIGGQTEEITQSSSSAEKRRDTEVILVNTKIDGPSKENLDTLDSVILTEEICPENEGERGNLERSEMEDSEIKTETPKLMETRETQTDALTEPSPDEEKVESAVGMKEENKDIHEDVVPDKIVEKNEQGKLGAGDERAKCEGIQPTVQATVQATAGSTIIEEEEEEEEEETEEEEEEEEEQRPIFLVNISFNQKLREPRDPEGQTIVRAKTFSSSSQQTLSEQEMKQAAILESKTAHPSFGDDGVAKGLSGGFVLNHKRFQGVYDVSVMQSSEAVYVHIRGVKVREMGQNQLFPAVSHLPEIKPAGMRDFSETKRRGKGQGRRLKRRKHKKAATSEGTIREHTKDIHVNKIVRDLSAPNTKSNASEKSTETAKDPLSQKSSGHEESTRSKSPPEKPRKTKRTTRSSIGVKFGYFRHRSAKSKLAESDKTAGKTATAVDPQSAVEPPAMPEKPPALPEKPPALPEKQPALPEKQPALPEKLPVLPEKLPALPEKLPALPEKLPALPENPPSLPEKPDISPDAPTLPLPEGVDKGEELGKDSSDQSKDDPQVVRHAAGEPTSEAVPETKPASSSPNVEVTCQAPKEGDAEKATAEKKSAEKETPPMDLPAAPAPNAEVGGEQPASKKKGTSRLNSASPLRKPRPLPRRRCTTQVQSDTGRLRKVSLVINPHLSGTSPTVVATFGSSSLRKGSGKGRRKTTKADKADKCKAAEGVPQQPQEQEPKESEESQASTSTPSGAGDKDQSESLKDMVSRELLHWKEFEDMAMYHEAVSETTKSATEHLLWTACPENCRDAFIKMAENSVNGKLLLHIQLDNMPAWVPARGLPVTFPGSREGIELE